MTLRRANFGRMAIRLRRAAMVALAAATLVINASQALAAEFIIHAEPLPIDALSFQDQNGSSLDLSAFGGKIVLLNLWATWCAPCRKELPSLDRLRQSLPSSDFEIIALSIDRDGVAAVHPFFKAIGITGLRIYVDPTGQATSTLKASGLPTTLLVDRAGREIGRLVGPAEWDGSDMRALIQSWLEADSATQAGTTDNYEPPPETE